ncbi:hypothetical protein H8B15_00350 [Hymenobacter sp. BT507]|uniref:Cthe-2314-like HEPN domain-containing protein n=1 Tax=Hymenobacter citatus TaxID=2763506 RepID=A0ABR7ME33_9BACT|nr:hypothetical protein [Hymenobacter citatus]MBC6609353.1 hypothetical protein [Hymenobacter citatus]
MQKLDYILDQCKKYKEMIATLPFIENDVRKAFFELNQANLDLYYKNMCWIYLTKAINDNEIKIDYSNKSIHTHVTELTSTTKILGDFYNARNYGNRGLVTSAWSTFEFCLTYLCDGLFDQEMKEQVLNKDNLEVRKWLKPYKIKESILLKIDRILSKNHLTHLSVNRKYDKVYSIYKEHYSGNMDEDKSFLSFFGKYRNAIHTNYIYHGKKYSYEFNEIEYIFNNQQPITHNIDLDITHHFDLVLNLSEVVKRLFLCTDITKFVKYPLENEP